MQRERLGLPAMTANLGVLAHAKAQKAGHESVEPKKTSSESRRVDPVPYLVQVGATTWARPAIRCSNKKTGSEKTLGTREVRGGRYKI